MVLLEDRIPDTSATSYFPMISDTSATSYFPMICVNCHDKATHESCCINLKYQAFVKTSVRLFRFYEITQSENN